jgi:hypothetical protein
MSEVLKLPESRMFKIGSIMIFIINAVLIIFGLIYAIHADLMPYHLAFIGESDYQTIAATYPNVALLSRLLIMLLGCLFLANGISNLFIWYVGFRKGERWAWISALGAALIVIPLMVIITIVAGLGFPFPIGLAALILWVTAMALTAKEALTSS